MKKFILILFFPGFAFCQSFEKEWQVSRDSGGITNCQRIASIGNHILIAGSIREYSYMRYYPFLLCADTSGNVAWSKIYEDTTGVTVVTPNTGFYKTYRITSVIAESSTITIGGIADSICLIRALPDSTWGLGYHAGIPFVMQTDTSGNVLWQKQYPSHFTYNQYISDNVVYLQQDSVGYVMSSSAVSQFGEPWMKGYKIDSRTGAVLSSSTIFGSGESMTKGVLHDGNIYLSYSTSTSTGITCLDTGFHCLWNIIIFDVEVNAIEDFIFSKNADILYLLATGEIGGMGGTSPSVIKYDLVNNTMWKSGSSMINTHGICIDADPFENMYPVVNGTPYALDSTGSFLWNFSGPEFINDLLVDSSFIYFTGVNTTKGFLRKTFASTPLCSNAGNLLTISRQDISPAAVAIFTDSINIANEYDLQLHSVDHLPLENDLCHTTGIFETPPGRQIKIFPNPANDQVEIQTGLEIKNISLFSMQGENVSENISIIANKLNIKNLCSGIYILKITSDSKTEKIKLIIEK